MMEQWKEEVYEACMKLPEYGLVKFTEGNVSAIDKEKGLFVIKPKGIPYENLKPEKMDVMDLNGNRFEGKSVPSIDMQTHLELYKAFPAIGAIVHTHSPWAVAFAQAGRSIPCYGVTHARYIYGEIPCVKVPETAGDYEKTTGQFITEELKKRQLDPLKIPAVLCEGHGPFSWGRNLKEAIEYAIIVEEIARLAACTEQVNPKVQPVKKEFIERYYQKH